MIPIEADGSSYTAFHRSLDAWSGLDCVRSQVWLLRVRLKFIGDNNPFVCAVNPEHRATR